MDRNVVILETARKLKAAGFPQKTFSGWEWSDGYPAYLIQPELIKRYGLWGTQDVKEYAAAPTAQELADVLPHEYDGRYLAVGANGTQFTAWYDFLEDWDAEPREDGQTMAEALAALWLKLQEAES